MGVKRFEDLQVYRLAEELADEIWSLVAPWDWFVKERVGKQITRAADSIGANIAEGTGRGSFIDNRRFMKISRGSLYETRHWLRRAYRRALLTDEQVSRLKPLLDELAPRLNAYLKSIGPQPKSQRTKDKRPMTKDKSMTFHHRQLDNGLDVIAEQNPDAHSVALGLFVNTGSRDEAADVNGVSHFLEHMMFKGSGKYTWEDVNRIFDEMGAKYNAFTSQEMTAYYANVLPEFTEKAVEHLSHLLRPAIRVEDFTTEKKVILEEIAMYLDDPGHRLYEKLMDVHFGNHPLSMSVLGTPQSIQKLERDQMAEYFARRYGPGNMVLAATGRLEFEQIVDLAQRYCGAWPHVDAPRNQPDPSYKPQRLALTDPKLSRQYLMGMTPGPSAQDERRFAARVLADVIGDSDGSRLYWALVDNAIAEEADFGFYPHDACGSFYLALTTSPGRSDEALKIALGELQKVRSDLNDDEVERAKNKIASSLVLQGEVPLGRMRSIGGQWTYNRQYRSLEMDMNTLLAITPDSLKNLMRDFPFDPMTLVSLGPGPDGN